VGRLQEGQISLQFQNMKQGEWMEHNRKLYALLFVPRLRKGCLIRHSITGQSLKKKIADFVSNSLI